MTTVAKPSENSKNPVTDYCNKLTVKQLPVQRELCEATFAKAKNAFFIGSPEMHQLAQNFMELIGAKRVLEIGTFTGASALAWAIVLPSDGHVLSVDISHEELEKVGLPIIEKHPELRKKIEFRLGSAMEALDELIRNGEAGTWDFVFIDADKLNHTAYYEKAVTLVRKGGVILVDNSLWSGRVVAPADEQTRAIDAANHHIFDDTRTASALLDIADGVHVTFKR